MSILARFARHGACCLLAAGVAGLGSPVTALAGPAAPAVELPHPALLLVADVQLKFQFANRGRVQPLLDALEKLDADIVKSRGKAPADGANQVRQIKTLAANAKAEMRGLAQRIRAANQVEAFNTFAVDNAKKRGLNAIASQLQGGGGAFAQLGRMDSLIDQEIGGLARSGGIKVSQIMNELFGIKEAKAGLGCSIAIYLLTMGQGTIANYKLCMGGAAR